MLHLLSDIVKGSMAFCSLRCLMAKRNPVRVLTMSLLIDVSGFPVHTTPTIRLSKQHQHASISGSYGLINLLKPVSK